MSAASTYWIYILECENGAYYTGYTKDLVRRFRQHVDGTAGVKYTRSNRPVRIAQCWRLTGTVGDALKVEYLIKRRGRSLKERLVREPGGLYAIVTGTVGAHVEPDDPARVERDARASTAADGGADPGSQP